MIQTNQPESAFPSTFKSLHPEEQQVHRWGMQLRDYFAAKALQSLLAHDAYLTKTNVTAERAYGLADAMLRAREEA
jgi:hypothetical protein